MATIVTRRCKDGSRSYRATIRIMRGNTVLHRETRSFRDKPTAQQWTRQREAALKHDGVGEKALAALTAKRALLVSALVDRYVAEFSPIKRWSSAKTCGLANMKRLLGHWDAASLSAEQIIAFVRQRLLDGVRPCTAYMDLKWLRVVLRVAKGAWGQPVQLDVLLTAISTAWHLRLISESARRERRPSSDELAQLTASFEESRCRRNLPMADIMHFAIASTRREAEICRLRWDDLNRDAMTLLVRDMKSPKGSRGNNVVVKLTREALAIIDRQPRIEDEDRIFPYNPKSIQGGFARACARLGIADLHFHDLRHEAISRLFEAGYQIHEVAQFSGHRDWGSLRRYTNLHPARLALREVA